MDRSIGLSMLASFGAFSLIMILAVAIRHFTGWTDPKGFMLMVGCWAAVAVYIEARQ